MNILIPNIMKKKGLIALFIIVIASIVSLTQLLAVKAIDPGELCGTWCISSQSNDCTLHAGDAGGTYTIICHNKLWP